MVFEKGGILELVQSINYSDGAVVHVWLEYGVGEEPFCKGVSRVRGGIISRDDLYRTRWSICWVDSASKIALGILWPIIVNYYSLSRKCKYRPCEKGE